MKKLLLIILFITAVKSYSQYEDGFQIARLKYPGGGDWYNDPSSEVNLLKFVNNNTTLKVNPSYVFVDINSTDIFSYSFLFITGHGNIVLSTSEANKLRKYCERGGFIFVDDDYGIDKSFRREIKKVFPNEPLVELPFDHEIYHNVFNFEYGPPKIHEHDDKVPQGFGIYLGERLTLFYTYESNPADGWADQEAHNDPQNKRVESLKFGANIIVYALTN